MNDEVVVYLAVLAQRGNICKDGFGHTEQLHSLVYDVGAQVIGQATAILSGFLPSIRLDKITITGEGGFKLHQMSQQAFGQYFLDRQKIAVPPGDSGKRSRSAPGLRQVPQAPQLLPRW